MLNSSVRGGFRIEDMAFGRCGALVAVFADSSSGSIVALRLRFLGEGALGCKVGFEVTLSLLLLR